MVLCVFCVYILPHWAISFKMHSCMQFLSVCPQGKDTQKFVCARVLEICLSWGESIRSFPRGIDNLKIVQGWLQFLCHRVEKHHLRIEAVSIFVGLILNAYRQVCLSKVFLF